MKGRIVGGALLAVAGVSLAGFGCWVASLPSRATQQAAPSISPQEAESTLAALRPPKRKRPLVAIIGLNDATETTDYVMPYGILRRADVADVVSVAPSPGPVRLFPALTVSPDATTTAFDTQHPQGADYVIVPAMSRDDDPQVLGWIRAQASKGAIVIAVCAGAKVVAAAGLLDGRRGTTHWYYLEELRDEHPAIEYVADRRLVVDRGVATTTGITASMPMMLTLIEAIAGRERAEAVSSELGVVQWDARHVSSAFTLTRSFALTVMGNRLRFWKHEELGVDLQPGVDEVSLALVADAWSRTYRSRALTFAGTADPLETRTGLRIVPDRVSTVRPPPERLLTIAPTRPVKALDDALEGIATRYGRATAEVVAMQLEYPAEPARVNAQQQPTGTPPAN